MKIDKKIMDRIVQRIVQAVNPLRIILFGSAARGEWEENSDLDLMVVIQDGKNKRKTECELYMRLSDIQIPVDIVVVTESDLHEYANNWSLVYYPALREGQEIYAA